MSSNGSSAMIEGLPVPNLSETSVLLIGEDQVLLVRYPGTHHSSIFVGAWLRIDYDSLHKQWVNGCRMVVSPDADPSANVLSMCETFIRVNLAEVKEHKVLSRTEATKFLAQEAAALFDRERKATAPAPAPIGKAFTPL